MRFFLSKNIDVIPITQDVKPKRICWPRSLALMKGVFKEPLSLTTLTTPFVSVIPCWRTPLLLVNDRRFQVIIWSEVSSPKRFKNCLLPPLWHIYRRYPDTRSKKHGYTDECALAVRCRSRSWQATWRNLRKWRLQASKTEVTCCPRGSLEYNAHSNKTSNYLVLTFDRTLSFKERKTKAAKKLKTKAISTSWGASASIFCSTALNIDNMLIMIAGVIKSRKPPVKTVITVTDEEIGLTNITIKSHVFLC